MGFPFFKSYNHNLNNEYNLILLKFSINKWFEQIIELLNFLKSDIYKIKEMNKNKDIFIKNIYCIILLDMNYNNTLLYNNWISLGIPVIIYVISNNKFYVKENQEFIFFQAFELKEENSSNNILLRYLTHR